MSANIHILQLATPNIDDYAVYSIASMYHFCQRNDFSFSVQREPLIDDMHINWTKIQLLKNTLENNPENDGFTILVDADTMILQPDFNLNKFLASFTNDSCHIMMPQDNPTNPFKRNRPNAGFIVVRNSETGREIIETWLADARGTCAQFNDTHPRNQLVFWNCVQPKYQENLVIMPLKYFHKKSSEAFIHHFMKRGGDHRSSKMKKMFGKIYPEDQLDKIKEKLSQQTDLINFYSKNSTN